MNYILDDFHSRVTIHSLYKSPTTTVTSFDEKPKMGKHRQWSDKLAAILDLGKFYSFCFIFFIFVTFSFDPFTQWDI